MNITVEISKENKQWKFYPEIKNKFFTTTLMKTLEEHQNFKVQEIELSILLTDDAHMQELNKKFRNKDKATNVLSFPDIEMNGEAPIEFIPNTDYIYLGDIAFGYDIIKQEAEDKKISFLDHFRHLTIHGILHLIGYDHEEQKEAELMENLEIKILQKFDIKSPY
ncbi:MAG: rRNA maturation RNase YbeY [Rickettsiales bacterium]|nr:MAG: rRNA maturation RNase YbeY [Rickettsiales bacterium]